MKQQESQTEIKLVALDLDGTLLNPQEEISVENHQAIQKARERGVKVIISTGRSLLRCRKYVESLNLFSYLVTVNGSEIWEKEGKLMERNPLPSELMKQMWDLSQLYNTNYWVVSTENVWRNEMPEDILNHQWLKFGFQTDNDTLRKKVLKELSNYPMLEISNSSPTNIEINTLGVNKAIAISKVCDRLNISMKNVMTIGDSLNDIEMITNAGLGVAMGNAQEMVKKSADWITHSNQENGVAAAIEKWILS